MHRVATWLHQAETAFNGSLHMLSERFGVPVRRHALPMGPLEMTSTIYRLFYVSSRILLIDLLHVDSECS